MSRLTRSKQALASLEAKTNKRITNVSKQKVPTGKIGKTRSIKKKVDQDENLLPPVKNSKTSSRKNAPSKTSVLGSKQHSTKEDDSSRYRSTELIIKSPALRDRTNTTSECVKDELSSKNSNEVLLNRKNNKSVQKQETRKITRKNTNKQDNLQVSLERYCIKTNVVKHNDLLTNCSKEIKEKSLDEKHVSKNTNKKDSEIASDLKIQKDANDNEEKKLSLSDKNSNSNITKNRGFRKKNISEVDIEELLSQDDEEMDKDNSVETGIQSSKNNDDQLLRSNDEKEKIKESQKTTKKFFKNIVPGNNIQLTSTKRKMRQFTKNKKKTDSNDSTFSPKVEESNELSEKKLRPRAVKNYCEVSKLSTSQDSNSLENKSAKKEEATTKKEDQKGIPIYKTIKLTDENVEDKKEIYDFPDDSQENQSKNKKRKKVAKRPTVKRLKKTTTSKVVATQKNKKKSVKKVVQFEKQTDQPINLIQNIVVNNIHTHITIPEHLQNAGDSTFADASTIKIISDRKLEGSERINLTTTPPVPKTITSELKLFGPKNVITSQPTTVYSNMVNHSLIRQSMSPIKKLDDHFDAGSPWRPNEAFSRIQRVVQSTPQINRLPLTREKKIPVPMMKLTEKSLCSEDTIHISSYLGNKQSNNLEKQEGNMLQKGNEVSPRTFGTVLSNLSPVKFNDIKDSNNTKNSINQSSHPQINQQSPSQTSPIQTTLPQEPIQQNKIPNTNIDVIAHTSPQKFLKKKTSIPSPFRFEKIRSSKRIAMQSPVSTSVKSPSQSSSQKENIDPDSEAGPSWLDKPKPTTLLRQSNLNNFLNIDEMPECTRISTVHGIFDDPHSTPINGRKPKQLTEEPNIENAFGFDDCDLDEVSQIGKSISMIATEKDVKMSIKGKLFRNARVKSAVPSRITENTVKKTLLKNVLKKTSQNKVVDVPKETDANIIEGEKDEVKNDAENNNKSESTKKAVLDAVSFSDTFDVLSENGEIEKVVLEEMPLFVDLEPAHFSQPPRRSYCKRKRDVRFDTSKEQYESDEDEHEKPKQKKKKESKLHKEEEKRMREWVQNVNKTFDEIDHYDLVVE